MGLKAVVRSDGRRAGARRSTMPDPMTDGPPSEQTHEVGRTRRFRLPHVDFVTVMFVILIVFLVLFLTAEMWLPHFPD